MQFNEDKSKQLINAIKNGIDSTSAYLEIKELIASGADVNKCNSRKQSVLMLACQQERKNYKLINLLVKNNVDINLRDYHNSTALMYLHDYLPNPFLKDEDISESEKIMELLINNGADINATDNFGHTALMKYSYLNDYRLTKLLINKGANISINSNKTAIDLTTNDDIKFLFKK